jgi:predicted alpha/beta hydrolase family esterase
VSSSSTVWNKAYSFSQRLIQQYKTKKIQEPIVLVGHSLGANEQIKVAKQLALAHVPVALLVTVDAVSPLRVPPNVALAVNIYKPSFVPMFSGLILIAEDPSRTRVKNYNINEIKGAHVNHFTIDKDAQVQQLMIDYILATLKKDHHTQG